MSNAAPAAGWFADPHDPSRLRWWDGTTWTEHVHPPVAPTPVVEVVAVVPQIAVAPVAAERPQERILEEYYGNEKEPSMFGLNFKLRVRISVGSGRSAHGKATISEIMGELPRFDEATERAELAAMEMTPEQIESAVQVQAKMASLIEKAEGNPIACKVAHKVLRKLAFSTARGGPEDAMNIVFDGRRYHAYGGMLNR